jgi:phage-related protein
LPPEDRAVIGRDILTLELGWPSGMPLCPSLKGRKGLWEVRCQLPRGRIARVLFCVHQAGTALLHGFEKKGQKTPDHEIAVAVRRMKGLET